MDRPAFFPKFSFYTMDTKGNEDTAHPCPIPPQDIDAENPDKWFIELIYEPLIKIIAELADEQDGIETTDIVDQLTNVLEGRLTELMDEERRFEQAVHALQKAAKRFKTTEEENILESAVKSNMVECKDHLDKICRERKDTKKAIIRLEKYKYQVDEVQQGREVSINPLDFITVNPFGIGGSWGHGGSWGDTSEEPKKPKKKR